MIKNTRMVSSTEAIQKHVGRNEKKHMESTGSVIDEPLHITEVANKVSISPKKIHPNIYNHLTLETNNHNGIENDILNPVREKSAAEMTPVEYYWAHKKVKNLTAKNARNSHLVSAALPSQMTQVVSPSAISSKLSLSSMNFHTLTNYN